MFMINQFLNVSFYVIYVIDRIYKVCKSVQCIISVCMLLFDSSLRFWLHPAFHEIYRKTSNISRTLVSNNIVDNSDVVGASPVGAAPTTSSFST